MLDKKHRNTLILSMICFMLSAFYFFFGIQFRETKNVPDIGEVFRKNNDLRRKIEGSLPWVNIETSSKIFPGDKLFTGAASLAELNILDQAQIEMDSSTLLKIDPKMADGMTFEGGLGYFTSRLTGKVAKNSIKLKNATIEIKGTGTEVSVNATEDKTIITALNGDVKVGTQTLAPNQLMGINKSGQTVIVNLPVKLISPKNAEEVLIQPSSPVHFKWKTLIPEVPLSLELSKSPAFDKVFFKKDVTGMEEDRVMVDSKMQGPIYWRVVQPGKEEYFYSQRFEYQPLNPPIIYLPVQHQNYPVETPLGPEISWEKKFDFTYEGEIQQLDGGIRGAQKFTGPNPSYIGKNLTKGHYQVRVRGIKNKLYTDWSPWRPFTVAISEQNTIELISPADMATATFLLPQRDVLFEWRGTITQSEVEIATDEAFKNVINRVITDKQTTIWHPQQVGRYFWRVKSSDRKTEARRSFVVAEPKLELLTPKDKTGYVFRDGGFENVHLTWSNDALDGQYSLEYANSPDFKSGFGHVELNKTEYELLVPRQKKAVYWRVKTKNQTSVTRMFRLYPAPPPGLDRPVLGMVKTKVREDTIVFGGTSKNRPSTNLGSNFIEIFLPQVAQAVSYHVQVMRDRSGKNLVVNKTLDSTIFRWNDPAPGDYFWRFYYETADGKKSPMSEVAQLVVEPKDPPKKIPQNQPKKEADLAPFSKIPY